MKDQQVLKEELDFELGLMTQVVDELEALQQDIQGRMSTIRERTAAAAFLAQFYSGVENILKRISKYHQVPLPQGDTWHVDLFRYFCDPPKAPLPLLFEQHLAKKLAPYRRFRHVVHHSYGFQIEWERMDEGISNIRSNFTEIQAKLALYTDSLTT